VEKAQAQLREAFAALASQALQTNAGEFLRSVRQQLETMLTAVRGDWTTHKKELEHLVKPLEDTLGKLDGQIRELEQKREGAYKGLDEQLRHLGQAQQSLQTATVKLEQALKSPIVRGSWGQFELRRVVELAGLEAHVHFAEQVTAEATRPDMIVYLPNRAALPVDAKAPMQAFLDAMDTSDADLRKARLKDHAGAVRSRVRELSQKRYWDQFTPSPEFVVMFVPNDTCLSAAFAQDPELLEFAFQQRVLLTTPVTLLALLKAVAYGWQQQAIAENASQIARQGKEIHDRVAVFVGHLKKTGENLGGAVQAYNAAVGSLETRLLPAVRRLRELGAATTDLPEIEAVDHQARQLDLPDSA
jgi:DNA recombination protein RmuC